jgi:hypothetical protein
LTGRARGRDQIRPAGYLTRFDFIGFSALAAGSRCRMSRMVTPTALCTMVTMPLPGSATISRGW